MIDLCVEHRRSTDSGFTLVELLIALVLAVGLSIILGQALLGAREAQRASNELILEPQVSGVRTVLQNLIEQSRPLKLRILGGREDPMFVGEATSMTFLSSYSPKGQFGGLYLSKLSASSSSRVGEGKLLYLEQQLFRPRRPAETNEAARPWKRTELLKLADGVTFSYYGNDGKRVKKSWTNQWSNPERIPERVRIEMRPAGSGHTESETIVVELPMAN